MLKWGRQEAEVEVLKGGLGLLYPQGPSTADRSFCQVSVLPSLSPVEKALCLRKEVRQGQGAGFIIIPAKGWRLLPGPGPRTSSV